MSQDPTQNRSQGRMINNPAHKELITEDKKRKTTGLPKKDDEVIISDEAKQEDFTTFDVDKVDDLEKAKKETDKNKE